jgi:hypothetical protein
MEAVIEQVASLYSEGRGAHASQNEIQYKKPDDVTLVAADDGGSGGKKT